MARRIGRGETGQLPPSLFAAEGVEPLPAGLLPLRDLTLAAFGARRDSRREWFDVRGVADDWNARTRHTRAGFAVAGIPDPDPREALAAWARMTGASR